jgi:hypothetical protein
VDPARADRRRRTPAVLIPPEWIRLERAAAVGISPALIAADERTDLGKLAGRERDGALEPPAAVETITVETAPATGPDSIAIAPDTNGLEVWLAPRVGCDRIGRPEGTRVGQR